MKKIFLTKDFKETQKLGEEFAQEIIGGRILALYGDLGSGKTTFVQGFARGLGIENKIVSPTFIIIRTYKFKTSSFAKASDDKQYLKSFYHIDLYRIDEKKDIEELGLFEIMNEKNDIVVIEWAEKIKNILPEERVDIYFENKSENERQITIQKIN